MRVLIYGGGGMLGHKMWQTFRDRFETWVTLRNPGAVPELFDQRRVIPGVDVTQLDAVAGCLTSVKPDVVVNCIGIVKQLAAAKDPIASLTVNSLFPHRLHRLCATVGARLILISTDCVFSGRKGGYAEDDVADAEDLYGRTKLLGEVTDSDALTIRTSIIGRELTGAAGLLEWLLSQRGERVEGYRRVIFSGLTTTVAATLVADLIERHAAVSGLYHVASEPVNKFDLVQRLNTAFDAGVTIEPSDRVTIDRSLDGRRFREATGFVAPTWDSMIAALAADPTPYDAWRSRIVS